MLKRLSKIILIISAIITATLLLAFWKINYILNSPIFKKSLSNFLSKKGITLKYDRLEVSIVNKIAKIKNLHLSYKDQLNVYIKNIKATDLWPVENLILEASSGKIEIKARNTAKNKKKRKPAFPIPKSISLKEIEIQIKGIPIRVKRLHLSSSQQGSFLITSSNVTLKGVISRRESEILLNIIHLNANSKDIGRILSQLNIHTKLPLLKENTFVDIKDVLLKINLKEGIVKAQLSNPNINRYTVKTNAFLTYNTKKKKLFIQLTKVHGKFERIKEIVPLFAKIKAFESIVVPSVKRAHIDNADLHIVIQKGVKELNLNATLSDLLVLVPKTKLEVESPFVTVNLTKQKANIALSLAKVDGLRASPCKVTITYKPKPVKVHVQATVKGRVKRVYTILEKVPIPQKVLKQLNQHRVLSGNLTADLTLNLKGKHLNLNVDGKIDNATVKDEFIPFPINAGKISINIDGTKILLTASRLRSKSLKAQRVKISIDKGKIEITSANANADISVFDIVRKHGIKTGNIHVSKASFSISKGRLTSVTATGNCLNLLYIYPKRNLTINVESSLFKVMYPEKILIKNAKVFINSAPLNVDQLIYFVRSKRTRLKIEANKLNELKRIAQQTTGKRIPLIFSPNDFLKATLAVESNPTKIILESATITNPNTPFSLKVKGTVSPPKAQLIFTISNGKDTFLLKLSKNGSIKLSAKGNLHIGQTLQLFKLEDKNFPLPWEGLITANLDAELNNGTSRPNLKGTLTLSGVKVKTSEITGTLSAYKQTIFTQRLFVINPGGEASIKGELNFSKGISFNVKATGSYLNINEFLPEKGKGKSSSKKASKRKPSIRGRVQVYFDNLVIKDWAFRNVNATARIDLSKHELDLYVAKAQVCGFNIRGSLSRKDKNTKINLSSKGFNKFNMLFKCLLHKEKPQLNGPFQYSLNISTSGTKKDLIKNLNGTLLLDSRKGKIYKLALFMKILQTLSIANILTLNLPQIGTKGYTYNRLFAKAKINKGIIHIEKAFMDSNALKLVPYGRIDLPKQKIELTVLAAPFTTVDKIISHIPILGKILTGESGTFISIPMKITGNLNDPTVVPLSPSAITKGIFGIFKRTLELPTEMVPKEK